MGHRLDVCICTLNPRPQIFDRVLRSIAHQGIDRDLYGVVIVDNGSTRPIGIEDCRALTEAGVKVRIVRDLRLGTIHARARAVRETNAEWVLFVDDDNELPENYIQSGLRILENQRGVGCVGGKLLWAGASQPPVWTRPFLPWMGVKDCGNQIMIGFTRYWGEWEPPTGGAFFHRSVLNEFLRKLDQNVETQELGRKGEKRLGPCEDALITAGAFDVGRACSYQPSLKLQHHINSKRLKMGYLIRMFYGYGRNQVILNLLTGRIYISPARYESFSGLLRTLKSLVRNEWRETSARFAFCMGAYYIGAFRRFKKTGKRRVPIRPEIGN